MGCGFCTNLFLHTPFLRGYADTGIQTEELCGNAGSGHGEESIASCSVEP